MAKQALKLPVTKRVIVSRTTTKASARPFGVKPVYTRLGRGQTGTVTTFTRFSTTHQKYEPARHMHEFIPDGSYKSYEFSDLGAFQFLYDPATYGPLVTTT